MKWGTLTGAPERESADIVLAFGAIQRLNDEEAEKLFYLAHRALEPSGKLITHDEVYVSGQSLAAKDILDRDRGEFVRTSDAYRALAEKSFREVKVLIRYTHLSIPYAHMILECTK